MSADELPAQRVLGARGKSQQPQPKTAFSASRTQPRAAVPHFCHGVRVEPVAVVVQARNPGGENRVILPTVNA